MWEVLKIWQLKLSIYLIVAEKKLCVNTIQISDYTMIVPPVLKYLKVSFSRKHKRNAWLESNNLRVKENRNLLYPNYILLKNL